MFYSLSDRLGGVFDKLRGRGALSEADVRSAMREVRVALLEADVALPVARAFVDSVTEKAIGQNVLRSITPGQLVVTRYDLGAGVVSGTFEFTARQSPTGPTVHLTEGRFDGIF